MVTDTRSTTPVSPATAIGDGYSDAAWPEAGRGFGQSVMVMAVALVYEVPPRGRTAGEAGGAAVWPLLERLLSTSCGSLEISGVLAAAEDAASTSVNALRTRLGRIADSPICR